MAGRHGKIKERRKRGEKRLEDSWEVYYKTKHPLPYDSVIVLPGISPKALKLTSTQNLGHGCL